MSLLRKTSEDLANFYLNNCQGKSSLFEIWEEGSARGDSVTPSTFNVEYREWMSKKLAAELERTCGGLLSLGCGNAAVEAVLVEQGYRVLAIDAMAEAVALARKKGVDALCADILQWEPEETWSVVYLDGVLGHLHDARLGLRPVLERVRTWLTPAAGGTATIIASNDAPDNGAPVQPAPGVDGFQWLSKGYLREQAIAAGFDDAETEEFRYQRPLSGERIRAIVVGHVHP